MASTGNRKSLSLRTRTFLICRDRAFPGIPPRLIGGPCTLGKLGVFTPNKIQIMDWAKKNSSHHAAVRRRDLASLDPDCELEIVHWFRAKAKAVTVFLPWVSIAKAMGELGRLECWVAKQANLTTNALADLLSDEEITRQVTLQNRAAIDYLLLLHEHTCEEFEGLCCFNLTSKAEDVRRSITKLKGMVEDIRKETGDWLDNLFGNLGLSSWTGSIIKTGLLVLFILFIIAVVFAVIKKLLFRLISSTTSPSINRIEAEEIEMQDLEAADSMHNSEDYHPETQGQWPIPFEDWPTNQEWHVECYQDSDLLEHPSEVLYIFPEVHLVFLAHPVLTGLTSELDAHLAQKSDKLIHMRHQEPGPFEESME
ncbi:hypothetical protein HGM15179_015050 [Zosterops borbonicus]|uniref:Envelope glycoprotein n=1 Tax=Zosterops borbonicus TaxID=364589 RepID=A0A8K1G5N7_9PASS|nr:hypothetical protein HGM15179_015050 [Zosterops borbonicus]